MCEASRAPAPGQQGRMPELPPGNLYYAIPSSVSAIHCPQKPPGAFPRAGIARHPIGMYRGWGKNKQDTRVGSQEAWLWDHCHLSGADAATGAAARAITEAVAQESKSSLLLTHLPPHFIYSDHHTSCIPHHPCPGRSMSSLYLCS